MDEESFIPDHELKAEWEQIKAARAHSKHFEILYHKYYAQVFRFIYTRTRDKELTADLTSDVFLKAMLALEKYDFKGVPFIAWLIRIALNEVAQYYRKAARARVICVNDNVMQVLFKEMDFQPHNDMAELVSKLIQHLEPEEVSMIELRIFEGRPFKEIGEILLITENNAKVRFYRIIDKLKKVFLEKYHG